MTEKKPHPATTGDDGPVPAARAASPKAPAKKGVYFAPGYFAPRYFAPRYFPSK